MTKIILLIIVLSSQAFGGPRIIGNGGDDIGLDFESSFRKALENIKLYKIAGLEDIAKIDFDKKLQGLKILTVDTPLRVYNNDYQQECVAINYPFQNIIQVNRGRWASIADDHIKESIALHEMLSLIGFESTGVYRSSSLYLSVFSLNADNIHLQNILYTSEFTVTALNSNAISADQINDLAVKHSGAPGVTAKLITLSDHRAPGLNRLILTLVKGISSNEADPNHSVSYEITYIHDLPSSIELVELFPDRYLLVFQAKVVIKSPDGTPQDKVETIKVEIFLNQNSDSPEALFSTCNAPPDSQGLIHIANCPLQDDGY